VSRQRVRRRTTWLGLLASCALGLSGCGGDDSAGAGGPSSRATTPSATSSLPTVHPADGRRISLAALSARTLDGYDYDNSLAKEIVFSSSHDLGQDITFSDVTVYPGTSNATAARLTIKNSSWNPEPHTSAPVTIDGEQWYHLTGPVGHGKHLEDYGTVHASRLVRISFELTGPASKRQSIVDSVLATVRLK
jgi:hypothetical protein